MNNKNLISEIENKLQFVVTTSIFFSGFVVAAFDFWKIKDFETLRRAWQFYGMVMVYLTCYVFFQFLSEKTKRGFLLAIKYFLIAGIGLFIIPIAFVLSVGTKTSSLETWINKWSLIISINGLPVVALLTLITIIIGLFFRDPISKSN